MRATAASCLYNENIDEPLICEVTGYRSNAVHSYKHTSDGQRKDISKVLYGNHDENVKKEVEGGAECKRAKIEVKPVRDLEKKGHISVSVNINVN